MRDAVDGWHGKHGIVFGARLVDVAFFLVDQPAAVISGGVGRIDTGGAIIVGERAVEIALLLEDVGSIIVALDVIRFDSNRNTVVGQRGVQLALFLLPTAAGTIERGERFVLIASRVNHAAAGREPRVKFVLVFVVLIAERKADYAILVVGRERRRYGVRRDN